jgi:uncharacterized membrane protein
MLHPIQPQGDAGLSGCGNSIYPHMDIRRWRPQRGNADVRKAEQEDGVHTAMKKILQVVIIILCIAGASLSALSLHNHYTTTSTEYCALDATFNCDVVNRSAYSRFLGVPVALIGLIGYGVLLVLAFRRDQLSAALGTAATWIGLGFALYLTYIEDRVLMTWCLLCIGSLIAISGITAICTFNYFYGRRNGVSRVETARADAAHDGGSTHG